MPLRNRLGSTMPSARSKRPTAAAPSMRAGYSWQKYSNWPSMMISARSRRLMPRNSDCSSMMPSACFMRPATRYSAFCSKNQPRYHARMDSSSVMEVRSRS